MRNLDYGSILEVLDKVYSFLPVKICFNGFELYNDYDSRHESEPGIFGEQLPPEKVVPERLKTALDNYDVTVNKLEIIMVHGHHSLVYMYGNKVKKGYYNT